jgi:hypothetical protein
MTQTQKTIGEIPATAGLVLNSRAEFRDLLIRSGLARGAAEKLSRGGWSALADETAEVESDRLLNEVAELAALLQEFSND